jgi:hypothetical protein
VTIAIVERFAQRSRRVDPESLADGGGPPVVWDLPHPSADRRAFVAQMAKATAHWAGMPLPWRDRWTLLRACLGTGGARLGALAMAPELLRKLRGGGIVAVTCFSTKDFALVDALSHLASMPRREVLASGTQYFGEFAFEMLAVIPYAYWLHGQGRLERTVACADTRALYYFSPHHEERAAQRSYVPITEYPVGEAGWRHYDRLAFPRTLDPRAWRPPPYKSIYRDARFQWAKPTCVVCNKYSDEHYGRHREPTNFMGPELLLAVIGRLRERYQVVYNRPRATDIVNDHQAIREMTDIGAVKRAYPDAITIQELHARHPELGFNELQLRVFAGCDKFVSVLGGSSYLASYFGGINVVYARRGWEVDCDAYTGWFDRFSGARVVPAATPDALLRAVERELA